jgi:hypothetical protein
VVFLLSFIASMNNSDNNTEHPSNDNSQKLSTHIITKVLAVGLFAQHYGAGGYGLSSLTLATAARHSASVASPRCHLKKMGSLVCS